MRVLAIVSIVTVLAVTTSAQAPGAKPKPAPPAGAKPAPAAQATAAKPIGSLAQVMRGIYFPNSNILFDVQSSDPENFGKKAEGAAGATSTFSGIYTGWQVVENAAIALYEGARLLEVRGRLCENGRPVPVDQKDWAPFVADLRKASEVMLKAARSKNREAASEATNDVAGACENCHIKYREPNPRCVP
jgi:hypothetical protein